MKILVIGDTHGQLNKIREIFPKLTNLDLIAHTGDHLEDGRALEREFGIPVVAVKGNCDGSYSADDFEIIETDYGRILLTHGHMQHVNYRLDNLYYKAMEENCNRHFLRPYSQSTGHGGRRHLPGQPRQPLAAKG